MTNCIHGSLFDAIFIFEFSRCPWAIMVGIVSRLYGDGAPAPRHFFRWSGQAAGVVVLIYIHRLVMSAPFVRRTRFSESDIILSMYPRCTWCSTTLFFSCAFYCCCCLHYFCSSGPGQQQQCWRCTAAVEGALWHVGGSVCPSVEAAFSFGCFEALWRAHQRILNAGSSTYTVSTATK